MLLGLGIVVGIVAQALFNISVVLSLVPTKGIPLPFVSYGGTSMMLTLVSVGVLLNISQQGTAQGGTSTMHR
jgi:cell division protein FtsW